MLIVSVSFQNYHNGAVSNQLTDVGREECVGGGIESVDALKVVHSTLYIRQPNNVVARTSL
jgi:hypothetical protein